MYASTNLVREPLMNTVTAINPTGAEIHSPETMPHSIEAEQQLLGAILSNNEVFDRADSLITSEHFFDPVHACLLYTSPSPRDATLSRMPSSA